MGFKVKKEFGVIGLGTFGISVVETFLKHNISVIVLDKDEEKIQKIASKVDFACTLDTTDEEALINSGIKNVDHVIVGIGDDVEGCIMTVMDLKNIGIENITVKAGNDKLASVLKSMGVEDIVRPEKEAGVMVAKRKLHRLVSDFVCMDDNHSLVQIKMDKEKLFNKPLMELEFRNKFNLNIVAIRKNSGLVIPNASTIIQRNDILYLIFHRIHLCRREYHLCRTGFLYIR